MHFSASEVTTTWFSAVNIIMIISHMQNTGMSCGTAGTGRVRGL